MLAADYRLGEGLLGRSDVVLRLLIGLRGLLKAGGVGRGFHSAASGTHLPTLARVSRR